MSGPKLTAKCKLFRPQAACSLIAGLVLLSFVWIGLPRIGSSQQPNTSARKQTLITSPATADPLISHSVDAVKPATLENKLAQGPDNRRNSGNRSENKARRNGSESQAGNKGVPVISGADEAAVLSFVKQHHPELANVLQSLKGRHAPAYARAIADLNRTRERLAQIETRDEVRYERELEIWKTKSRIQLLVVRIKMNPGDEALRAEFKSLVSQQVQQHKDQLLAERERMEQRLEKINEQLEKLSENSDQLIERQMKQWLASGDFALRKQASKGKNPQSTQANLKAKKSATVPVKNEVKKDSEP